MTPSARLQAVIDILGALETSAAPADRFLRDWARAHRFAGSKDRAAIAERVYDVLRHRISYSWRVQGDDPRRLVIASLAAEQRSSEEIVALFDGSPYGPTPLAADEAAALASPPVDPPLYVRGEFPAFLEAELSRAFGPVLLEEMEALASRASVDLRVNTLKATRHSVLAAFQAEGFAAEPTPYAPHGLRLPSGEGLAKLSASALYMEGAFEFQDEASQIAALLCAATPGARVLDLAAGAGGKSLALAAAMRNEGEILAFDDKPERLKPLPERAARAGASCITVARTRGGPPWGNGKFDVVLVDAPCSGTGTWRRQPELRGRLTPDSLIRLHQAQDWLLEDGARHTKPGSRLVYATCSLLPSENDDRIAAFRAGHPDFTPLSAADLWACVVHSPPPPGLGEVFRASPRSTGTDGFFTAVLQRQR